MKTIKEIFVNNPALLETEEVKELVEQFKKQSQVHEMKYYKYWDKITTLTMNSDLFVINGISCKEVVEKIHNLSFK